MTNTETTVLVPLDTLTELRARVWELPYLVQAADRLLDRHGEHGQAAKQHPNLYASPALNWSSSAGRYLLPTEITDETPEWDRPYFMQAAEADAAWRAAYSRADSERFGIDVALRELGAG
jgi:hypothetical protein